MSKKSKKLSPREALIKAIEESRLSQKEIAFILSNLKKGLKLRQASVSTWIHREGRLPAPYVTKMVQLCNGAVTAHELRPDIFDE